MKAIRDRIIALLLAISVLVTLTAFAEDATDLGRAPYDETITITFAGTEETDALSYCEDDETRENNRWTKLYKEALNIDLKAKWISSDYPTKLNMAIASGDLPDAFRCNYTQMKQMVDAGLLYDMTEVYEQYATSETKKFMDLYPAGFESGIIDDKLYGLSMQHYGTVTQCKYMWIRNDWLEQLGMEAPTTVEGLTELAKAFMEADFDGNGINDTYGIALDSSLLNLFYMFPCFGASGESWVLDEDNRIVYGRTQSNVKEALACFAEWYQEGILSNEFAAKTTAQMNADMINGKVGIIFMRHNWGLSVGNAMVEANGVNSIFYPYDIPTVTGEHVTQEMPWQVTDYCVVSKNCKNPEAVMKLINVYTDFRAGKSEYDFDYYMTNRHTLSAPFVVNDPTSDNQQNKDIKIAITTGDASFITDATTLDKYNTCMKWLNEQDPGSVGIYLQVSDKGAYEIGNKYIDNGRYSITKLGGQQPETMQERGAALNSMLSEGMVQIIMGEQSIDYFDTLTNNWLEAGGAQITEEVNEIYG